MPVLRTKSTNHGHKEYLKSIPALGQSEAPQENYYVVFVQLGGKERKHSFVPTPNVHAGFNKFGNPEKL